MADVGALVGVVDGDHVVAARNLSFRRFSTRPRLATSLPPNHDLKRAKRQTRNRAMSRSDRKRITRETTVDEG